MEVPEKEVVPLQGSNHRSGGEITSEMGMDPMEWHPSISSMAMVDNQQAFDQGSNFSSSDTYQVQVNGSSFEEFCASIKGDVKNTQEAIEVDYDGIEDGDARGTGLYQEGLFNMDEIWAEMEPSSEAQVQAQLVAPTTQQLAPTTHQQQNGSDAIITASQQVTLENVLGKPNFIPEVLTRKEFILFEFSPGPANPMEHANHHGPLMDSVGKPNGSYPIVGHGMMFPHGCQEMPLVPLPNLTQDKRTSAFPNSSNGMTSIEHASMLQSIASAVTKRNTRRCRDHDVEFIEENMEKRQKKMIKNRESAARSRERKQVCVNYHSKYLFRRSLILCHGIGMSN
jgi:hypothetical protein